MQPQNDLLFGRIAVEKGYVTEADVQECVAEQGASKPSRPLGEMLLERGTITRRQMDAIVAVQQQRLSAENPRTRQRREDTLFGRLAWRLGMLEQDDLNACLRRQAAKLAEGTFVSLGEILKQEGYLTERQVLSILEVQKKAVLYCPPCMVLYTLKGLAGRDVIESLSALRCPRCKGALLEPSDEIPEEVEWVTLPLEGLPVRAPSTVSPTPQIPRHPTRRIEEPAAPPAPVLDPEQELAAAASAAAEEPPAPVPAAAPAADSSAKTTPCQCPVCDTRFEATPDKFDRVKCPKCRTGSLAI